MSTVVRPYEPAEALLRHHGDRDLAQGLVDLAVNVRPGTPPAWLASRLAAVDLSRYPNGSAARAAVAARHGRTEDEVLLTAGAAEAFVLIARALAPRHAVVVHPQFTEPELALRAAGHGVERVVLSWPFTLDAAAVPATADLVVLGNPTNPTSVLHPAQALRALARPGRLLVVDEAFADCVPGEPESLAAEGNLAGVIVVRSLTKMWGLAGLRAGYLLADPGVVATLERVQPHWAVSAPALAACAACSADDAVAEATAWAHSLAHERGHLVGLLAALPGIRVVPDPQASFVLIHIDLDEAHSALRSKGFAVRSGHTFPGLGPGWLRVAVRDHDTSTAFAAALKELV
ncbi:MAG: threonine-phosphate decarboxylase [Pseudonocardiales bacterium]|nr:MAG: threonine-phosphate decarboxylase [Pseudonocardiales bacterium]